MDQKLSRTFKTMLSVYRFRRSACFDVVHLLLLQIIIQMRCTDRALLTFAAGLGVIVIAMQTIPIFTDQWVHTTEPRPINRTDENDVQQVFSTDLNIELL